MFSCYLSISISICIYTYIYTHTHTHTCDLVRTTVNTLKNLYLAFANLVAAVLQSLFKGWAFGSSTMPQRTSSTWLCGWVGVYVRVYMCVCVCVILKHSSIVSFCSATRLLMVGKSHIDIFMNCIHVFGNFFHQCFVPHRNYMTLLFTALFNCAGP